MQALKTYASMFMGSLHVVDIRVIQNIQVIGFLVHGFEQRLYSLHDVVHLLGQPIKSNWAYASGQMEDTSGHFNIFVGDLSPEVTDATLFGCFSVVPNRSDARVMWDQKTGRSRGFGFWLGNRRMRCNWATKGAGSNDDKQSRDAKGVVELTNGSSEDGKETATNEAPDNNPQYTTVYVGNLAPEVTQLDLHRHFHTFGARVIEEVRIQRDKDFGFQANSIRNKFKPIPPPAAAPLPSLSAIDLLAYERQLTMSKMGGVHALMHFQGQQ
ncbi:hypothetical protein AAG906_020479 [Vitis piasezkii]